MPISTLFSQNPTPNILILITDQQRSVQSWPAAYQQTLLSQMPATQLLMASGINLRNTFTGACMCSPSRATFLTSQYPPSTGVTKTGTPEPPTSLPTPPDPPDPDGFNNLATVLNAAGYQCYWLGKWHLGGPSSTSLDDYGFQRWDPPDAGNTLGPTFLGGGTIPGGSNNQNDQRYLADALAFMSAPPAQPWCLVVSLVNPHDVHLGYEQNTNPDDALASTYYHTSDYVGFGAPLPTNVDENLATQDKPRAQASKSWDSAINPGSSLQPPTGADAQQNYVDFYAYLDSYVEGQLSDLLGNASQDLLDHTLIIRFADHGEMGLNHNQVEKFTNVYEQTLNVPLVFSNPIAWPSAVESDALVSLIDLAPTLADLLGVTSDFTSFCGKSLTTILNDPTQSVQDVVHFTYDDNKGAGPSVIRAIRTAQYKYAVYSHADAQSQRAYPGGDWELYDLNNDPDENTNLAGNPAYQAIQAQMQQLLEQEMASKGTQPTFDWPPKYDVNNSRGGPP